MTERARGWAAPHLLAGRGSAGMIIVGVLILIGACTDTMAFKSALDLLINQPALMSWLMACGATALALVAAGSAGVALITVRHESSHAGRATVVVLLLAWLLLGAALFAVRWQVTDLAATGSGTSAGSVTGSFGGSSMTAGSDDTGSTGHYAAFFFAALYLISGLCTLFEAARLYNPDFLAYRRIGSELRRQQVRVRKAAALKTRADSAVDLCIGQFDQEDSRRRSAIGERQALGTELANYARYLMTKLLQDPARTNLTETGPLPRLADADDGRDETEQRLTS
jgi:hypothetical protein